MRAHIAYLRYVLRHKWFVLIAGIRVGGIPLWRLVVHDWSKFTRVEWTPYVHQFYNPDGTSRRVLDSEGRYDPGVQSQAYKDAWQHHWQNNPHHWNHWTGKNKYVLDWFTAFGSVEVDTNPSDLVWPMPSVFIREMIADWIGAGRAQGKPDIMQWYEANKERMKLHNETRFIVERILVDMQSRGYIP